MYLTGLEADTKYRITIWPLTGAGIGEPFFVERSSVKGGGMLAKHILCLSEFVCKNVDNLVSANSDACNYI